MCITILLANDMKPSFAPEDRFFLTMILLRIHRGTALEVSMATITVKNIPGELYNRLKVICIGKAVSSFWINTDEILENARRFRQLTAGHPISDEDLNRAKSKDRL